MKAKIIEVKRFAVHDGDGIRTTVFFKGCPLKCIWCHNPEGIGFETQLAYYRNKCISCGECGKACVQEAHVFQGDIHIVERGKCAACGACELLCPQNALILYGREVTTEELLPVLLEDADFYRVSGGGVTLSGGECLMQAVFCEELLRRLKENNISTAVDTCGFIARESLERVAPYTDIFLYDIKAMDEELHIRCTGQSNRIILENLKYLDACKKKTEIRIPFVPEYNKNEIEKIGEFLAGLNHVTGVRILPYHKYAGSKYEALDMKAVLPEKVPEEEELQNAREIMAKYVPVRE